MREYTVSHATIYVRAGDRALIDRVRALTRQQGTSLSALTIRLLREWEERQEAEAEAYLEGLAEDYAYDLWEDGRR